LRDRDGAHAVRRHREMETHSPHVETLQLWRKVFLTSSSAAAFAARRRRYRLVGTSRHVLPRHNEICHSLPLTGSIWA
jgi:hypothetical protein